MPRAFKLHQINLGVLLKLSSLSPLRFGKDVLGCTEFLPNQSFQKIMFVKGFVLNSFLLKKNSIKKKNNN